MATALDCKGAGEKLGKKYTRRNFDCRTRLKNALRSRFLLLLRPEGICPVGEQDAIVAGQGLAGKDSRQGRALRNQLV